MYLRWGFSYYIHIHAEISLYDRWIRWIQVLSSSVVSADFWMVAYTRDVKEHAVSGLPNLLACMHCHSKDPYITAPAAHSLCDCQAKPDSRWSCYSGRRGAVEWQDYCRSWNQQKKNRQSLVHTQGRVYLYDSLKPKKVVPQLQKQLATLWPSYAWKGASSFHTSSTTSEGSHWLWMFCSGFAVSLLFRGDPSSLLYNQKE